MAQKNQQAAQAAADRKSVLRAPVIQALIIQLGSLLVILIAAYSANKFAGQKFSPLLVVLSQGIVAAFVTYCRRFAPWWILIQLLFPIALLAMLALHLPSSIFLFAFLFLLALYWTTFRTQVPFFPSGPQTWKTVAAMLPQERSFRMVDIGSGLGGLVLHLARDRPESVFTGIEIAPLPWVVSALRACIQSSQARFIRGDYGRLNFQDYDVVFAYLSPAAMPALWDKACAEMRQGTLLISYEFPIPGVPPNIISLPDSGGASIYGWHME